MSGVRIPGIQFTWRSGFFQFKPVPKDDDEGFVDTSSNSTENSPLIANDDGGKRKKKKDSKTSQGSNENKRVSFQVTEPEVQPEDPDSKPSKERGRNNLAPLPSKRSSRDHKSHHRSSSRDDSDKKSRSNERHADRHGRHSRHGAEKDRRSRSRASTVQEQESNV